jgi:hypothetical protein
MNAYLINPDIVTSYGEWGCHGCQDGRRDLLPETADREARRHLQSTGHDVFLVRGTAQALHAIKTEPEVPA